MGVGADTLLDVEELDSIPTEEQAMTLLSLQASNSKSPQSVLNTCWVELSDEVLLVEFARTNKAKLVSKLVWLEQVVTFNRPSLEGLNLNQTSGEKLVQREPMKGIAKSSVALAVLPEKKKESPAEVRLT